MNSLKTTEEESRPVNRWKRAYALDVALAQAPEAVKIKEEQASGIRADCRSFFRLVRWRLNEIPELLPWSQGPADSVSASVWWENHPADALNTMRLYREPRENWTESEWACTARAARSAVKYRKGEVEEILKAGMDGKLESYLRALMTEKGFSAEDARTCVENYSLPLDERWRAFEKLSAEKAVGEGEKEWTAFKEAAHELVYQEIVAGTTLAELHPKSGVFPEAIREEVLRSAMKAVAKSSPYELSAFVNTLPSGAPLRLHGIRLLLESIETDSPEATAWRAALEAETPQ